MPFSVQSVLIKNDDCKLFTIDLIADYRFNHLFSKTVKDINKKFHLCNVNCISDTQTSFTINKGQKQEELLCVLCYVFVLVSEYDLDITKVRESGIANVLNQMGKLVFPGVAPVQNNRANYDILEPVIKWSLDNTIYLPEVLEGIWSIQQNLNLTSKVMKTIVSLEDKGVFTRFFNSSNIARAKLYLDQINKMLQDLHDTESEAQNLKGEIQEYLNLEKFSGISYEEIQKKSDRMCELKGSIHNLKISYYKSFSAMRKLAKQYDLDIFYF